MKKLSIILSLVFLVMVVYVATMTQHKSSSLVNKFEPNQIEKIDFKKYLVDKYESDNPWSKSNQDGEVNMCERGSVNVYKVEYGDITGDGVEEAVVEYRSCNNGTGGPSSEIFQLSNNGQIINLELVNLPPDEYHKFFIGHVKAGNFKIKDSKLLYYYHVYLPGDPNCCPGGGINMITFNWNGKYFVPEKVEKVDPNINIY